jgi:TPP-dependent pyruvate/acetoin dehydrogenase alpha subunit
VRDESRAGWLYEHGVDAWTRMRTIRELEGRLADFSNRKLIRGSTHPSVGMEAVAVGVSLHLRPTDVITSTHRGHGHCLAKGAEPRRMIAELFGRATGYCGGKGGSMHMGSKELGILGTNGIVGASIGLATGAALALQRRHDHSVALAYFGDGALNQGMFAEALNIAAIWKLPCVYVCENNQYAQSAPIKDMVAIDDLTIRGTALGVRSIAVDGMDVQSVSSVAADSIDRARAGNGPSFIVAETYRFLGHMVGDTEIYRDAQEVASWQQRDPIARLERELVEEGILSAGDLVEHEELIRHALDDAEGMAADDPQPVRADAFTNVYGEPLHD